ncbi:unnamed protein product [Adineta ricciae]|nr:unnamed protein product [Adineta ricciae]
MVKWEVQTQYAGITNTMKINILSAIRTLIETHGSSKMSEIGCSVKNWLQETYGGIWIVIIGKKYQFSAAAVHYDQMFLRVYENDLDWQIDLFKSQPNASGKTICTMTAIHETVKLRLRNQSVHTTTCKLITRYNKMHYNSATLTIFLEDHLLNKITFF